MKRQYIIFLLTIGSLVGSLVAVIGTIRDRDYQLRGYVDATIDANLPYRLPRLGVNVELQQYTLTELDRHLDRMEAAGITWIRQHFRWDELEPERGQYRWYQMDTIFDTVRQRPTLHLVAVLVNSPTWARTSLAADNPSGPPDNPADFARFVAAFAARYGEMIDYYEIWDEPNLTAAWGGLDPRPVEYLALLEAAYTAIHAQDPLASVIVGGLAPTTETGPKNISDILYLRDLYALGAKDYIDAIAAKPHGFNTAPSDRNVDGNTLNFSRIIALREEMVRNGDGKKALWAASWGWNSLPDNWTGAQSIWGSVSTDLQITYTLSALERVEREWPWLAGMILQHWQPAAPSDDPIWGFALIDQQDSPSPLYTALANRPQPIAASNGLYATQNPYSRYSGVWTFGQLGADIGWLRDSQLDFDFTGREIALLLRKDDYVGYLYSAIDGQPANALPHDSDGNAYVVLTSGNRLPEVSLVPIAVNLNNSPHRLHVIADRGWDRWALAGYAVSSGNLAEPFERQVTIASVTSILAVISVIVAGWQIQWRALSPHLTIVLKGLNFTTQLLFSAATSLALMLGMLLTWGDGSPNILRRDTVQIGLSVVTAGLIYLEPGVIITVAAGIALFVIFYSRFEIGLLHTLIWSPLFLFPVELYKFAFPMVEIMILLTFGAWLLSILTAWGRGHQSVVSQFVPKPIVYHLRNLKSLDWAVASWLALGLISLLWTARLPQAFTELRVMMIEPCLFYLVLRTARLDKGGMIRLIDALLLAGLVVALIGLVTYLNPQLRITAEGGAQRLTSVYGSPNNVGLFLGRCLPFVMAFLLVKTDQRRRLLAAFLFVVMGLAAILTQSVGALFVGIPAAIISVMVFTFGKRAWRLLLGLTAVGVVAFTVAMQFPRFARVLNFTEGTNFFRLRVWESTIDLIQDHPLTGVGLDQFLYEFRGKYIRPDAEAEPDLSHPHNVVLDFWVRLGVLGVAILIWIQVEFWRSAKRNYHRLKGNPVLWACTIGLMGSMVNLLAHGLIDNSVYVIDLAYVFVLLLGMNINLSNTGAIDVDTI